ncbi:hypothetical protein GCM10010191_57530 [Actinomadura vinacea]|uniref:Uncharacterized protein n=1 Tax=Actinomadura vinacea TaxID=115336 RepID=A0ABP5WWC5_9ACTN
MQPAPIREGAHWAPGPVPCARARRSAAEPPRSLSRRLAQAAAVAGLALAGWLLLSALSGAAASASATDLGGETGDLAPALTAHTERAYGEVLSHTPAGELDGVVGGRRLLHAPSTTVGRLVDGVRRVSDASGLEELRPAGTALIRKTGLPSDRRAVDDLLSPLTGQKAPNGTLLDSGGFSVPGDAQDSETDARRPESPRDAFSTMAPGLRSGASAGAGCRSCARTGHAPSAPQPVMPSGHEDVSAAFLQTGQAPGPMAGGTLPSPVQAAPATVDARALPAAAMEDKSSPARPMVVPD